MSRWLRTPAPLRPLDDAAAILTVYVVVLLAIPAPLVVGALGTAGSPATILAIGAFCWWAWYHAQRDYAVPTRFHPVRATGVLLLVVMVAVYVHAMLGPVPTAELTPADSGLLRLTGMVGILLVANDGIASLDRHRTLVRRVVLAAGAVAALGILQQLTHQSLVDRISLPGLVAGNADWALGARSGLARVSGTSTHPIEFGVMLTMALPLAVVQALHAPTRRWLYRTVLVLIAIAVFLSISRSAIVCAGLALLWLALGWSTAMRLKAMAFLAAMVVVVYVSVPGLVGTLASLFSGISEDTSIASRTGSYDLAAVFISRSPWLGRGLGTFLPDYWILDNAYLLMLIEGGALGLTALLLVLVAAAVTGTRAARVADDPLDREVSRALVASVLAGAGGLAFFDSFAFPQSAGILFLMIGLTGAAWRLQRERLAGGARAEAVAR